MCVYACYEFACICIEGYEECKWKDVNNHWCHCLWGRDQDPGSGIWGREASLQVLSDCLHFELWECTTY